MGQSLGLYAALEIIGLPSCGLARDCQVVALPCFDHALFNGVGCSGKPGRPCVVPAAAVSEFLDGREAEGDIGAYFRRYRGQQNLKAFYDMIRKVAPEIISVQKIKNNCFQLSYRYPDAATQEWIESFANPVSLEGNHFCININYAEMCPKIEMCGTHTYLAGFLTLESSKSVRRRSDCGRNVSEN